MVNKVVLVGRLGKDPETRYTGGGQAVTNFSLATSEKFKDKSGQKQERTEWHRITAWGKLAEICQQYLTKGSLVYAEGSIHTRKWQDKEGADRYSTEITIQQMKMLGGGERRDNSGGGDFEHGGPGGPSTQPAAPEISDEDIPF